MVLKANKWLIDGLIDWLIDWLTDWLIAVLYSSRRVVREYKLLNHRYREAYDYLYHLKILLILFILIAAYTYVENRVLGCDSDG